MTMTSLQQVQAGLVPELPAEGTIIVDVFGDPIDNVGPTLEQLGPVTGFVGPTLAEAHPFPWWLLILAGGFYLLSKKKRG